MLNNASRFFYCKVLFFSLFSRFIMKYVFIVFFLLPLCATAQYVLQGNVVDENTEPIPGAVITTSQNSFARSNFNGAFTLNIPTDTATINCNYLGYHKFEQKITKSDGTFLQIKLTKKNNQLNIVTISGSRFEKKIEEETVSIEVLKPNRILSTGINSMDDALNRVPGVDVVENQINIRGGAGWSYGAGSRVQVLVDDMPMLTADAADAKLNYLPIENCQQIEIIKGASSCLYGSSALNGAVNFRTDYATTKPKTKVMIFNAIYGNPKEKERRWWGKKQPSFNGGYFSHAQKFDNLDVVIGSAWYSEDSYLEGDLERRVRLNVNLRYHDKKVAGLVYGINANSQLSKAQTFFFWEVDSNRKGNYYQPFGGLDDATTTVNKLNGQRINIDPYIIYTSPNGLRQTLRTRWFRTRNDIPEKMQTSIADLYYGEYQLQKAFNHKKGILHQATITGGLVGTYQNVIGELYGNHAGNNYAAYTQIEKKIGKLWLSGGARYEANRVDTFALESRPVFRLGSNYQLAKGTFLRASYGQGYRYPSIAERFIRTSFGPTRIFPNPNLTSETGWSTELGVKQLWQSDNWFGYFDIAGFWSEYQDMMEFNFGFFLPADSTNLQVARPLDYIGFRSNNVGRSRVTGIDFSTYGQGKMGALDVNYLLGYTYMNPVQVNPDSAVIANLSGDTYTLKYRYNHTVKMDAQATYKKITVGYVALYNSFMKNVDEVFENNDDEKNIFGALFESGTGGLPSSIRTFRQRYNKGAFVLDLRTSLALSKQITISFIAQNVLNTVYSQRPSLVAAPRSFTLQLRADL